MGRRTPWRRALAAGTAVAALVLAAAGGRAQVTDPVLGPESLIDRPALELSARRMPGGEPVRLAEMRGKVVLVELASTWCSHCREATTRLDRLQQRHRDSLQVIIVLGDGRDAARAYLQQNPVEATIAWDDGDTRRRYGARMLPTFVLIDRSGFVRRVFVGAREETLSELEEAVHGHVR